MGNKKPGTSRLKVSIIEPLGNHGGMDYYNYSLCSGLSSMGLNTTLYTSEIKLKENSHHCFKTRYTYKGIYGRKPKIIRGLVHIAGTIMSLLESKLSGTRICHFHLFSPGVLETLSLLLARILDFEIVVTAHDIESLDQDTVSPAFPGLCYRIADKIIAHNNWTANKIENRFHVPKKKIFVIPHGNYISTIPVLPSREKARKVLGIPEDAITLLFFGHIKKAKGLEILLNAMPEIVARYPETRLIIAGRPWKVDYSYYSMLIDRLGLRQNCIQKIEFIPHDKLGEYFSASDLVVLPYLKIYQSGVMILAMSYGKPVLVSDLQPFKEIITDGINGFLFKAGDSLALAEKICSIVSDRRKMETIAKNGYNFVERDFNWDVVCEKTLACYSGHGQP